MTMRTCVLALALGACAFPKPADVSDQPTITVVDGDAQSGTSGSALAAPLIVNVVDPFGNPLENYTVEFAVTAGGGALSASSERTDTDGNAQVDLTLGPLDGSNTVVASGVDTTSTAAFTATGVAGTATQLLATSGDDQTAVVSTAAAMPVVVTAEDVHGNPVGDLAVSFSVSSGGGSVDTPSATTDANGQAETNVVAGAAVGDNVIQANASGVTPATFDLYGATGLPAMISIVSGNNQTAPAGSAAAPLIVLVEDAGGNAIEGAAVEFAVTAGSGNVTPTATTSGSGMAETSWTFGLSLATATISADVGALTPAVFDEHPRSFGTRTDVAVGTGGATALAVGDLNRDGKPDIAAVTTSGLIAIINTTIADATTPTLGSATTVRHAAESFTQIAIADVSADGNPDIFYDDDVSGPDGGIFATLNATGSGSSTPSFGTTLQLDSSVGSSFVVADFNGDGRQDAATPNRGVSDDFWVLVNTEVGSGSGSGSGSVEFDEYSVGIVGIAESTATCIGSADMNGDTAPDVLIGGYYSASAFIVVELDDPDAPPTELFGGGTVRYNTRATPLEIQAVDINGDGKPDLVFGEGTGSGSGAGSGTDSVALNTSSGSTPSFAAQVDFAGAGTPFVLADVNNDGAPDLIGVVPGGIAVSLNTTAPGATTPSFAAPVIFTVPSPVAVATGDINGDGYVDLIATGSNGVSILLSQ